MIYNHFKKNKVVGEIMNEQLFYKEIAKYYDKIYHFIEYEKQAKYFIKLINKFNKSGNNKILDVCCGTGTHIILLKKEGFDITGLDMSDDMLNLAKKKNPDIRFIKNNMRTFDLKEKFGTIICFFNALVYNKNEEEMKKALSNLYSHLEKGGILIFDTVNKSAGIKAEKRFYKYEDKDMEIIFEPQWVFNESKNIIDLEIDFTINGEKIHDHHVVGAFSSDELKKIAESVGFRVSVLEKNFDEVKPFSEGDYAVFLCIKD